jgi:cytochrome b involved in lipid metabolism
MRVSIISGCLVAAVGVGIYSCDKATEEPTTAGIAAATMATHNTAADCWVSINSTVYNLTSFLSIHSGGDAAISSFCGYDASTAFNNKHGSSATAKAAAEAYKVGVLTGTTSEGVSAYSMTSVAKHNTAVIQTVVFS